MCGQGRDPSPLRLMLRWASSTSSCTPARARSSRSLESIVPAVGAFEPEMQRALRRRAPRAHRRRSGSGSTTCPTTTRASTSSTTSSPRRSRWCARRRKRVLGQRHFDVQIMGGAALHFGWVAEMKTGEGKTLVATLPLYLNALAGRGVHLVTVNDYLAKFHAEWMGRIYRFLGLEVGRGPPADRRPRREARGVRRRHHLRHQQRVRLRLPPRQHGGHRATSRCSAATSSPSSTRSTRSSSTRRARR